MHIYFARHLFVIILAFPILLFASSYYALIKASWSPKRGEGQSPAGLHSIRAAKQFEFQPGYLAYVATCQLRIVPVSRSTYGMSVALQLHKPQGPKGRARCPIHRAKFPGMRSWLRQQCRWARGPA